MYPEEDWKLEEGSEPLTLSYIPSADDEFLVNINVQKIAQYDGEFTEKDAEDIKAEHKDIVLNTITVLAQTTENIE